MSSNIGPGSGDGAPDPGQAPPDPYAALREAGFDPDNTNWAEIYSKAQYVDALTDPNRHFDVLEGSLREWGHLDADQSLGDLFGGGQTGGAPPAPAYTQGDQQGRTIIGYDAEDEPIWSAPAQPQQPQFNPDELEQRIVQRMQQEIQQSQQATRQEIVANQMAADLDRQMESAKAQHGLSDEEASFLWSNVRNRISSMQGLTDPQQIQGIVDNEWSRIDALTTQRLQRLAQNSQQTPRTFVQGGPPPADNGGQTTGQNPWDSMMGETARRMGIQD